MIATKMFKNILSESSFPRLPCHIIDMIMEYTYAASRQYLFDIYDEGTQSLMRREALRDRMVDQWLMDNIRKATLASGYNTIRFTSKDVQKNRPSYTLVKDAALRLPASVFTVKISKKDVEGYRDRSGVTIETVHECKIVWDTAPPKKKRKKKK